MTVKTTLNSAAVTDLIGDRELEGSERFVFLVEAKPGPQVRPSPGEGVDSQKLVVEDVWDASGDDSVPDLLRKLRALDRVERDEKNGVKPLASYSDQPVMYTDPSGVVMTANEIAALRGESWTDTDMFVIEFEAQPDEEPRRELWPDHFPKQDLASPGGWMALPPDFSERARVVLYRDAGDPTRIIAEWSDADREAEEAAQLAKEAAADREAVEELEAHRTPQISGKAISAMKAGDVVQFVKVCDGKDQSWLGRALHWERGREKPRRSVMNALVEKMTDLGIDTEAADV